MDLGTNASDYSTARAFADETDYNPSRDSFASVILRAAINFGSGVAITALLAAVVPH